MSREKNKPGMRLAARLFIGEIALYETNIYEINLLRIPPNQPILGKRDLANRPSSRDQPGPRAHNRPAVTYRDRSSCYFCTDLFLLVVNVVRVVGGSRKR